MGRKHNLHHFWTNHRYLLSANFMISFFGECLFQCKVVILGMLLLLADFILLMMMVMGVFPTNFELCFLGLIMIAVGSALNLVGWTSYIGSKRA